MNQLVGLLLLAMLSACSSYKPIVGYPSNGGFGYSEQKLGENNFLIRIDGKDEEPYQELRIKLTRRAAELCNGSFELTEYTKKQGFVIHAKRVHWPFVTAKVLCTDEAIDQSVLFY